MMGYIKLPMTGRFLPKCNTYHKLDYRSYHAPNNRI